MSGEAIEAEVIVVRTTEKAVLIREEDSLDRVLVDGEHWLPKSQIDFGNGADPDDLVGEQINARIARWIAEQNGILRG